MKTKIKNGLFVAGFLILMNLPASCLRNNSFDELYTLTDAELVKFSLMHDSLPELENVVFTIDQRNGLIFNYDSMAYKTVIPDSVNIQYASGNGLYNVFLYVAGGDSVWIRSGDSVCIKEPLTLKVFALDETTKLYEVRLNIHQMDPDSIQYFRVASGLPFLQTDDTKTVVLGDSYLAYSKIGGTIQLYTSSDAENWSQQTSGLPANTIVRGILSYGDRLYACTEDFELYVREDLSDDIWAPANDPALIKIKTILGYLPGGPKQAEGLSVVIETDGKNVFAFTDDLIQWDYDSETPVPDDFPLYDFSSHCYELMQTGRINVFGGIAADGTVLNTAWSTENGRYWAKLTGSVNLFPPLSGANFFYYNQEFWLLGGRSNNVYNENIYYSKDRGVTWFRKQDQYVYDNGEVFQFPCAIPNNLLRYNASIVTDKDNKYFYVVGGKKDVFIPDVWRCFMNKMIFEH